MQAVPGLSCVMADKALRPKWNGAALKKHREACGWSVEKLAQALGMTNPGLVYKWENGESMPKADWLAAIVIVLNQPAIRFFTGIDEFQGRLKGEALIGRHEITLSVEGEETGTFFSTADASAAARRGAAREPEKLSPPVSATTTSEPKRGRRSPKRRA